MDFKHNPKIAEKLQKVKHASPMLSLNAASLMSKF